MFTKYQFIISGIVGFLAVALGAFGAHGLEGSINKEMMETYETGVLYHLVHAVVLFAIPLAGRTDDFCIAFRFFTAGIVLFSFSLYLLAITGATWLGFITPFGGVSFLIGWFLVIRYGIKMKVGK